MNAQHRGPVIKFTVSQGHCRGCAFYILQPNVNERRSPSPSGVPHGTLFWKKYVVNGEGQMFVFFKHELLELNN